RPPTAQAGRRAEPGTTRPCVPTPPVRGAARASRTSRGAVSGTRSGSRRATGATRHRRRRAHRCARSRPPSPSLRAPRPKTVRRRCRRRRAGSPPGLLLLAVLHAPRHHHPDVLEVLAEDLVEMVGDLLRLPSTVAP